MLHYKAVAKTPMEKISDIMLGVFGMAAMIFTAVQTIKAGFHLSILRNDSDGTHSSWLSRDLYQHLTPAEGSAGFDWRDG